MDPRRIDIDEMALKLGSGDRAALARAITLIESTRADHRENAARLVDLLMPRTGGAIRIGLSGVPGAGKSTLIDALGTHLTRAGRKVAVLSVDPSSHRTGGSILGDKTRMERLSVDPSAFIRPSPTAGTLGGVAARTRETILLCEAAGFDVVIVETVGVGQSEITVAHMVDVFLLLVLAGAGDDLQGIKKGILEVADIVAVNKADGANEDKARLAASDLRAALHILAPRSSLWTPPVLALSGQTGSGIDALWDTVLQFRDVHEAAGSIAVRRAEQEVRWMWSIIDEGLRRVLLDRPQIVAASMAGEADVAAGRRSASAVAGEILSLLRR